MSIPTPREAADRADEVQRAVEGILQGESHEVVHCVCATILSQAVADISETPEQAEHAIDRYAALIKWDIRKNWHLVTARRKRQ